MSPLRASLALLPFQFRPVADAVTEAVESSHRALWGRDLTDAGTVWRVRSDRLVMVHDGGPLSSYTGDPETIAAYYAAVETASLGCAYVQPDDCASDIIVFDRMIA